MSELSLRRSLDESLHDTLVPGAFIVGVTYLASGSIHRSATFNGTEILAPAELVMGGLLLLLGFVCRGKQFSPWATHRIASLIVSPLLISNSIYLHFNTQPQPTFGLYILCIGVGMISFPLPWYAGLTSAACLIWLQTVMRSESSLVDWSESGVILFSMIAAGSAMRIWRHRYLIRLDELQREATQTRAAHARNERRIREIMEQVNDMITEVTADGTIVYANPAHERIIGYKPEELIGRTAWFVVEPEYRDRGPGFVARALIGGKPRERIFVRHKDGSPRTIETNVRAFQDPDGEARVVVTSRDVTQQVRSEHALREGRDALEKLVGERNQALATSLDELKRSARLASMGTLAAGIAHQINNPIGSILMSAELAIQSDGDLEERQIWQAALRNNVEQARRCGKIVSRMLQFARNEPTEKTREDLGRIVQRVCKQTEGYAREWDATIDATRIVERLPIHASSIELEQAFLNILRNAIESAAGGIHVEISTAQIGHFARATIVDNGRGMEREQAEHAFDPFFTTRLARGGTGLGLSVAHGVVVDHGGSLSLESEPGQGTRVVLDLPLLDCDEDD